MHADHVFKIIDAHVGGAKARMVYSGIPHLPGESVMDKMQHFAAKHDWIRRTLVLEPRGGGPTSVVVFVPPSHPEADVGAFFMEPHGYLAMCGSDTISAVTALIETGQIVPTGSRTVVRIDTPAGLIEATADVGAGNRVTSVTFLGAPAFRAIADYSLHVPGYKTVTVDVAYGGNFYVIAEATQFGLTLAADQTGPAVEVARALHAAINASVDVRHPDIPGIEGVTHVQLFIQPEHESEPTRVMVIMPPGIVDRSACGTGTTAKVATLIARGDLDLDQPYVHQSVTGDTFTGRAVRSTVAGSLPACQVAITGRAYLIADTTIFVDRADPLAEGFQLS